MEEKTKLKLKKIGLLLKAAKPYLFTIDEAITEFGDGIMRLDVRIYKGRVTDVLVHKTKRFKFKRLRRA